MKNIKIFDLDLWRSSILESSSAATGWPVENSQQRWKTRAWRSTGITGEYIRTTGGPSLTAQGFFIFSHNVTGTGVVTVKGSNDNWISTPFSQVMTRAENQYVYIPAAPQVYDDFGIFIDDAANTDGYISLGRIWIGECYEPEYGYNPDVNFDPVDPSVVLESTGGQVATLDREKYKRWTMPFDCINDKDRYDLFIKRIGKSMPFVFLRKPKGYIYADYPEPEINSYYASLTNYQTSPLAGNKHRAVLEAKEER